jgi:hypothetical protein
MKGGRLLPRRPGGRTACALIGLRPDRLSAPFTEIVVSSTVKDLVAGSGIAFEGRGEHELKGVPGSWRLFVVRG